MSERNEEVLVTWKERAAIEITIDSDALTWADLLSFQALNERKEKGEITEYQMLEELNKVLSKLIGQDVTQLPARIVNRLLEEFTKLAGGSEELKN